MLRCISSRMANEVRRMTMQAPRQTFYTTTTTRYASTPSSSVEISDVAQPGTGPNHRSVMSLDGNSIRPYVQPNAFVAPNASVIGSVVINDKAMISYGSVIRGDLALIHIGFNSIIHDNTILTAGEVIESSTSQQKPDSNRNTSNAPTTKHNLSPTDAIAAGLSIEPELLIGDFSVIGANSHLHACFLDGDNHVGHCCVIEEGVRMKRFSQLLPNSTLTAGTQVGEAEIWAGSPAVKVGVVPPDDRVPRRAQVMADYKTTTEHMYEFLPVGTTYWEKEELQKKIE